MTWRAVFENPVEGVVDGGEYLVRVGKNLVRVTAHAVYTGQPPNMQRLPDKWWAVRADTLAPLKKIYSAKDFLPTQSVQPFESQEGVIDGTPWHLSRARYAKGQFLVRHKSRDSWKSRGDRLAEALNGRYTHRERAYVLSPTKAKKWLELLQSGWDAATFHIDPRKPPPLIPPRGR